MEGEGMTPADAGNAPLGVDEGASAIQSILFGEPGAATPNEEDDDGAETVEASEEAEAEAEGEEPEAETDDEAPEPEPDPESKVRLLDGTEITLAEVENLRKSGLREADYTRKTQELAAQRKEFEAKIAEVTQRSQLFEERIDLVSRVVEAHLPPAPDPAMLETDPIGFIQAKAARDEAEKRLHAIARIKQEHAENAQKAQLEEFKKYAEAEAERLVEVFPQLKDESKRNAFLNDLRANMSFYGYSEGDLKQVYDHRLVRMAYDAAQYRKLMAQKPKVAEKAKDAAPVVKAGKRQTAADARTQALRDAQRQLRSTGSLDAGAAAIEALLFRK